MVLQHFPSLVGIASLRFVAVVSSETKNNFHLVILHKVQICVSTYNAGTKEGE